VKDVDFGYAKITVRDGKGAKDRVIMLPLNLTAALQRQRQKVKAQFEEDLESGLAGVHLPHALARKYPNAAAASIGTSGKKFATARRPHTAGRQCATRTLREPGRT
jgi:integrase